MSSLLVDLGGTDLKVGIAREGINRIESFTRVRMPDSIENNAFRLEISQERFLEKLMPLIQTAIDRNLDVARIMISGQMGCWTLDGFLSMEGKLVSWQDRRILEGYRDLQEVISGFHLDGVVRSNGNEIGTGVPLVGLISMLEDLQGLQQKCRFQSLISWTVSKLINSESAPMHVSDAASSGLLNLENGTWNQIVNSQFSNIQFPEIVEDVLPVGKFGGTEIDVHCGVGDQQASLLGVGISEDVIVLNIGTGGQVATLRYGQHGANVKKRPFFGGKTIYTVTHRLSGRFLNKVLEVLSSTSANTWTHEDLNLVQVPSGTQVPILDTRLVLDSWYLEEMARDLGIERFAQSAILTMARDYISAIEELGGVQGRKLIFAGGVGQKNRALTTVLLRELKNPDYQISSEVETTLAGLRILSEQV